MIFDNIFEAIRKIDKNNVVLNLEKKQGYLKRTNQFELMQMPDGKLGAFPPTTNIFFQYYRGENEDYDKKYPCIPSIFRTFRREEIDEDGKRKKELILIDELKIIEFELTIKSFPQIKQAIKNNFKIDYSALAQHYELNTDLLDLTSDIVTAAFFATHKYNKEQKNYIPKKDGIGCLRRYIGNILFEGNSNFRVIGLQPFKRPGRQAAFALKMRQGEDFSKHSSKIIFKQNYGINKKLGDNFLTNENTFFPKEEISDIAKTIKLSKIIPRIVIEEYLKRNKDVTNEKIENILKIYNYKIDTKRKNLISRQRLRKIKRKFNGRLYSDLSFKTRFSL